METNERPTPARAGPRDGATDQTRTDRPTMAHWTFYPGPQHLWWSDEMYVMHGYGVGDVAPSPELVVAHKTEPFRAQAGDNFAQMAHGDRAFSFPHTILDADGHERHVVTVGQAHRDASGRVGSFSGCMLDVTDFVVADRSAATRAAVAAATEHRAAIEQAKGMLMMAYGVDADASMALLKRVSQESNVKVHTIATGLVAALSTAPDGLDAGRVSALLESLRRP